MFNQLTLKQRVVIQLVLNVTLQVVVVTGVLMDWSKTTLILSSLGVGLFMLWLYLDSALASKQFVDELISGADRMGHGDLTKDVSTSFGNPTLREGLGTMQALQARIRSMLGALNEGAWQVSNASSEIAAGNQDLSRRTEQGSSELQSATSAMKEMTDAAAQSSEAMQKATSLSQGTSALVHTSGDVVNQAVAAMGEINNSSRRIADIISVIDGIAFQTNILALNAAVEAARAGEQGRGFAVVASEVRSLAGRSAEAAKEIKSLITASVDQVEKGASLVNDAGVKMGEVVKAIEAVSGLIVEASGKSQQQTRGLHEISTTLEHLDVAMQQNAALVEQETAAAESLKHQAAKLHSLVGEFKLPGNTLGMGAHAAPPARPARPAAVAHNRVPAPKALAKPVTKPVSKPAARPVQKLAAPKPRTIAAPKPAARGANDDWETF
ncbi:MAG: methyl-accepting chemotaxis protein [Pseudomonadota bacterium]